MPEEADVGILYYTSNLPGFRGVLKQRYTDFIVNEVDCNGKVIHLTSLDAPVEEKKAVLDSSTVTNEVANKECQTSNVNNSDYSKHIEAFESLAGKVDAEKLKDLLGHISAGSTENLSPIVLSADPDKAHRTALHNFFKTNLNFLVTDTIEGTDSNSKCVRVRYYPNKKGAHGRDRDCRRQGDKKRKNWGSKEDRNPKRGKYDGGLSGDLDQAFDSRGADEWPEDRGKFLRFHLCKENKDTQEALMVIGKMLGVQTRSFGFAGTKDKRAVTTQRVTIFKQEASRIAALNKRLYGIKVGDFCYVKDGLVLGQLSGNRFTITLRGVVAGRHDIIKEAAEGLGKNGFINYFGLQRFGSGSVPTHSIGAALLRGEWKTAVDLILDPRDGERRDIKEAREYYKSTMDINGTLKQMPRYLVAERAILTCLKKNPNNYLQAICSIPRTLRMMYVHSYQSYLWNHAASARVQKYGVEKVIEGDLVYCKEIEVDKQNPNNKDEKEDVDEAAGYDFDVIDETTECDLSQESVSVAKIVDADDIALGKYTIDDVLLPLPGSRIIYPANDIAETFHNLAGKDSVNLQDSLHNVKEYSIMSLAGGYRKLIQKPIDYIWNIIKYEDPTQQLVKTDLDALAKCNDGDNNVPQQTSNENSTELEKLSTFEGEQNPQNNVVGGYAEQELKTNVKEVNLDGGSEPSSHTALQISFTLPTSCYATMAIRELLKTSTSTAFHKTLND
ncbi:multisubstrate pseudouridine synthase 7 [Cryptomeria japonica]|uniref:multisubstrate pseudouridine synthase 7 n=1 Tax=Cryptomeria japonica TaxID=3369 RepID=UPI0027D9E1DA|nr:multisubstrate pseudouridine synthase 7 [Cryptomeria japonica]XP_057871904.2 multisubstrate pseudouridine synthase 7 [Cryptomeria japonica]XP_057871905.2 multisubstrate pseudouridine synthase 7 [Cryptomeria japonica]XP_057871906.2 multisubstrate pseudouridine synthase 7 [Cryptomeria japonica]